MRILCGDIGGTNARLALWDGALMQERTWPSRDQGSLDGPVGAWLDHFGVKPDAACFAVAGPVTDNRCVTTNLPWVVDGAAMGARFGFPVRVINDFSAAARGTTLLSSGDVVQIGRGARVPGAPVAVIGAGTGLGEAFLVGGHVIAGEGGHADFGPSTEREAALAAWLLARFGHASWERVLCGTGLANLERYRLHCAGQAEPEWLDGKDAPARVTASSPETVAWFCELYGAEAGNMALRVLARGGVYLCGGIAPRVIPQLQAGGFRDRFEGKGRLAPALADVPTFVVTHPALGLLGAAAEVHAG
jgi:glucokinase